MTTERDARLEATGAWTLVAWGAANSSTKYITYCETCRIPTIEIPCLTCQAWCDAGRHIQLAAHARKSVRPKTTLKKEEGGNHEQ
jgi:hypothetical protein